MTELVAALKACADAMRKSQEIGCTDHLDAADDGGRFWHDALQAADRLIEKCKPLLPKEQR